MIRIFARSVLYVSLFAALGAPAAAQPADQPVAPAPQASTDDWEIMVAPYLLLAGMSGTLGVKGYEVPVDVSASDLFSHLKGGFMGYVGAKKNGWGFGVDTNYMKLGASVTKGPVTVEPDVTQGAYTFLASRQLTPVVDLVFGARINHVSTALVVTAPIQRAPSDSKTWVDPVVGVNILVPAGKKTTVGLLADLGGFGAGSTIAADIFPTVQITVAKHARLALGYRFIYTDYSDDAGFLYKVWVQGPAFGVVIPF
jgi:hypothetical protein